jgi:hypothetical protein
MDKQRPAGTVVFRAGEQIIHYYGEIIDKRTLNERYGRYTAPYAVELTKNRGGGGELNPACRKRQTGVVLTTLSLSLSLGAGCTGGLPDDSTVGLDEPNCCLPVVGVHNSPR